MSVAARNAILAGGAALPYDAEVEYLQSTGTQWIVTGVIASDGIVISGKTMRLNSNSVLGWNSSNCITLGVYFRWQGSPVISNIPENQIYEFEWGPQVYTDGVFQGGRSKTPAQQLNVVLFARSLTGNDPYKGRIWWLKIQNEQGLVRDFIPVRVGSGASAVGYMYDRVSGQLFGNAGTGAFVIGPDK